MQEMQPQPHIQTNIYSALLAFQFFSQVIKTAQLSLMHSYFISIESLFAKELC